MCQKATIANTLKIAEKMTKSNVNDIEMQKTKLIK